jgi:hypothetical protein
MGDPSADDLDGISRVGKYADDTVVRVFVMRTSADTYPSGWAYKLHYGATRPSPPDTLDDGTIRRYDNSHEDTNCTRHPTRSRRPSSSPGWWNSGIGSGARYRKKRSRSSERTVPRGDSND